uniref:Multifunctional fusion protein n=1 Tax=uncultured bacterium BAC-AB1442/1414/561 TaxID=1562172 RepID=A0A0C4S6G6_9BACT|nr:acetyl-CoA carboxyltransferase subunit beta [uncultured bacterium BAC-AB1442/1414/561]
MTQTLRKTRTAEPAPAASAWILCQGCRQPLYIARFERDLRVCQHCEWHGGMTAHERLQHLFDPDSWMALPVAAGADDPLGFVDVRPYRERLCAARAATGLVDAVLGATGTVAGLPVVAAAMDFRFLGGSLGSAAGEMLTRAAEVALRTRSPFVIFSASGGARMQEGALALMQMAKVAQAITALDDAGLLTVSVITDPTYGGVAASFASMCDVVIAEHDARLGFAGPRVVEQITGRPLPPDLQKAASLYRRGFVDRVVRRRELWDVLRQLTTVGHPARRTGPAALSAPAAPPRPPSRPSSETVRLARHIDRPTTSDYLSRLIDGFQELHGDRAGGDCPATMAGLGFLDGSPVALIGVQKGHSAAELARTNFGMATPSGYRKAARIMRLAAKLGIPIVTLIDTPGADPGPASEEAGQAGAIAENLRLMFRLPVPIVAVLTGEGGSGGALGLAVADRVLMLENAFYSVISPEGCAAILWKSGEATGRAADALRLDSGFLLDSGIVDELVPEPDGGAHRDHAAAAAILRRALVGTLAEISRQDGSTLVRRRRERFRRFGADSLADLVAVA